MTTTSVSISIYCYYTRVCNNETMRQTLILQNNAISSQYRCDEGVIFPMTDGKTIIVDPNFISIIVERRFSFRDTIIQKMQLVIQCYYYELKKWFTACLCTSSASQLLSTNISAYWQHCWSGYVDI